MVRTHTAMWRACAISSLILLLAASCGAATAQPPASDLPFHPGLRLFSHDEDPSIQPDAIGLRFRGPLTYPLAENLRDLLLRTPQIYNHVVLELDSEGGELSYVEKLIAVLAEVRNRTEFTTRVMGYGICASGCIPVFMQGSKRKASGASVWVFHGATSAYTNIPNPLATEEYLELLQASGVRPEFLQYLRDKNYVSLPGNYFQSGYELFMVRNAGIITELLPPWQPEDPVFPPAFHSR